MWYEEMWEAMVAFFIICIIVALGVGMLAMWGLPKLWEIIKPWIHAVTA